MIGLVLMAFLLGLAAGQRLLMRGRSLGPKAYLAVEVAGPLPLAVPLHWSVCHLTALYSPEYAGILVTAVVAFAFLAAAAQWLPAGPRLSLLIPAALLLVFTASSAWGSSNLVCQAFVEITPQVVAVSGLAALALLIGASLAVVGFVRRRRLRERWPWWRLPYSLIAVPAMAMAVAIALTEACLWGCVEDLSPGVSACVPRERWEACLLLGARERAAAGPGSVGAWARRIEEQWGYPLAPQCAFDLADSDAAGRARRVGKLDGESDPLDAAVGLVCALEDSDPGVRHAGREAAGRLPGRQRVAALLRRADAQGHREPCVFCELLGLVGQQRQRPR